MATLGDIAERAATRVLNRTDELRDEAINCCADAYRAMCSGVPFDDIQVVSSEISTVADQVAYELSTLRPLLRAIDSIRYTQSGGTTRRLRRSHVRQYDAQSSATSSSSGPYSYGRQGSTIEFNPAPDSASDTFRIRYWSLPDISTTDTKRHVIEIGVEWHEILLWETVYRLYHFLETPEKAHQLMQPSFVMPGGGRKRSVDIGILPRLWNEHLSTIYEREFADEDFSINPVYRRYTSTGR